jgi:hypothetical protein
MFDERWFMCVGLPTASVVAGGDKSNARGSLFLLRGTFGEMEKEDGAIC